MYCIKCGVKLADGERECPLCQTRVAHPDLAVADGERLYPENSLPARQRTSRLGQIILTALCVLALAVVLLCDLQFSGAVTWSGYVMGALGVGYVMLVLPLWFRRPNPVIFVPCAFAAVALYLLYIDLAVGGKWFLSFAFPLTGGLGVLLTAVVTLWRYVGRGRLYIAGGALLALGVFMLPLEYLTALTWDLRWIGWSLYPLISLAVLGGLLIFLAICRPARESMERRFFF